MKLKYQMSVLNIGGEPVAVPADSGNEFQGVLRMNETAADILKYLEEDRTEEEIAALMLQEYDASEQVMREAVRKIVGILRENDLLIEK